jgi:hypothetical protein
MRDSKLFDKAVAKFFEPVAQKLGLSLAKIGEGVYEIPSSYFILRVRLHSGHARGLNVLLRPTSARYFDENKTGSEYGIGCFIQFQGEDIKQIMVDVNTDEDFLKQAKLLAEAAERFGSPYLLGKRNDFEAVKEFINARGEPESERIKQMQRNIEHNMPSVRQEWIIPDDELPE